jgi:aldehyde:ferredoxin oxidoreductase
LPERFLAQPLSDDDQARLTREDLLAAVESYNTQRGWTSNGWIDERGLETLQLADL